MNDMYFSMTMDMTVYVLTRMLGVDMVITVRSRFGLCNDSILDYDDLNKY